MKKIVSLGLAALLALSLPSCGAQGNAAQESEPSAVSVPLAAASGVSQSGGDETAREEAGVSESFYAVAQDLASRFLILDADGKRLDDALETVDRYLNGELGQEEALAVLNEAIGDCGQALGEEKTVVLGDGFTEQLRDCSISPEEYEAFANSRAMDLQSQQTDLSTLLLYLKNAEASDDARENLRFFQELHARIQDSMRGYYYYGCLNYWFPGADEAELACLQELILSRVSSYLPQDAEWLTDADAVEARVMEYLDEVEEAQMLLAQHVGEEQTELYELEQDAQSSGQTSAETPQNSAGPDGGGAEPTLEEQQALLDRLLEINERIEALSAQIEAASEAGDEERLAELRVEFEAVVAEYEALVGED